MARASDHSDANPVHGSNDALIEVGENYEELWFRVDHGCARRSVAELIDGRSSAERAVTGRIVLVDDQAIAIWSAPEIGAALFVDEHGWKRSISLGVTRDEIAAVITGLVADGDLPSGWTAVDPC